MSIAVRELGMGDRLMLEELVDALTRDAEGTPVVDALAPVASGALAFLASGDSFAYAAYLDNDVAGGFWGVRIRRPDGAVSVEIFDLHVMTGARRQGIGTLLVEAAVAHARRADAADVVLRGGPDVAALATSLGAAEADRRLMRWSLR